MAKAKYRENNKVCATCKYCHMEFKDHDETYVCKYTENKSMTVALYGVCSKYQR